MAAKYKIGEHVASRNSGLVYIVKTIHELDLTGELLGELINVCRAINLIDSHLLVTLQNFFTYQAYTSVRTKHPNQHHGIISQIPPLDRRYSSTRLAPAPRVLIVNISPI